MNRRSCIAATLSIALAVLPGAAAAVTLLNGDLESSSSGLIETVFPPNASNDWRVTTSSIEFVKNGYSAFGDTVASAHSGVWFVDLNGVNGPGAISQEIDAATGQQYRVDFWMSANPGPNGSTSNDGFRTLNVLWNGVVAAGARFDFQVGDRWDNLRWQKHSVVVTGADALDTLEFRSTSSTYLAAGPFVDTISITPVPEPQTWGLLGAGLAAVGLRMRRRRVR